MSDGPHWTSSAFTPYIQSGANTNFKFPVVSCFSGMQTNTSLNKSPHRVQRNSCFCAYIIYDSTQPCHHRVCVCGPCFWCLSLKQIAYGIIDVYIYYIVVTANSAKSEISIYSTSGATAASSRRW